MKKILNKIQVITDSTSDISREMADELAIKVVPIYLRFGDKLYRDGVDLSTDQFYSMLENSQYHPATSQPTPEDFSAVYKEYCEKSDGIISVHISSKISGTYNSAVIAKKMLGSECPIEVVDSRFNSAGLALLVMAAARLAKTKNSITAIAEEIRHTVSKVHMLGIFDTMKYLARSGRVSKSIVAAANILSVKPMLTFHEGDIVRAGLVRSLAKGMDRLYRFVDSKKNIAELAIVHSAVPIQAEKLKERLSSFLPLEKIRIMKLGAGLGVHGGPGVLLVGLREN
jgi:DegV family protein with EDD domain